MCIRDREKNAAGAFENPPGGVFLPGNNEVEEIHGADDEGWNDLRPEPIEPWVDDCEQAVKMCIRDSYGDGRHGEDQARSRSREAF